MDKVPGSGVEEDRSLVEELAQLVLEQAAPEELLIFNETADEYFRDPDRVLDPKRRDEAVGFGLDMAMLTPYVIAVVTSCLSFLAKTVAETATSEATKPAIGGLVRRFFRRRHEGEPEDDAPALSRDQAEVVRELAFGRAKDLARSDEHARLLADAVVGGLNVAG
jgi:hypothetical protein